MILKVFSVRDKKAGVFHAPFTQRTHGEAERTFQQLSKDPNSLVAKYPEDYDLMYIGEFDDNQGTYAIDGLPKFVATNLSENVPQKEALKMI